ncbi:MAG: sodium:proton antiporter [Alphaproteobacteria bacterium]|nr:sodium:proton antiporter [Alphaproteobacteria bacterium]
MSLSTIARGASLALPVLIASSCGPAFAAEETVNGRQLTLIWVLPFAGILLSIALMPLLTPHFWHSHFGKVSLFWALAFIIPFGTLYGGDTAFAAVMHTLLLEYVPFIILIFTLFVIAGGIYVSGTLIGTPLTNTGLLALGTLMASFVGTTGASMVLIRPMIRANHHRKRNVHVFVFFVFLVSNIGGSLTPLGDPPLFLGFLKGVAFDWTVTHMFAPMMLAAAILLAVFFVIDAALFERERHHLVGEQAPAAVRIRGVHNILLLAGVIMAVLMSGIWKSGVTFHLFDQPLKLEDLTRDAILLGLAAVSIVTTTTQVRLENAFTWAPIREVATLFLAIFLTIIPALAILRAGSQGALADLVALVSTADGSPNDVMYFWLTGVLSSFLDNAPTYLVFFNLAGGDAQVLMGPLASTLLAISVGAVFMGANTYIGNAPNFMVKAICEENKIAMPSFFGYMGWSIVFLGPIYVILTFVFF